MRTYKEVLEDGIQLLETAAIEEARLDAWLLLEYTADITRAWYYAHMDDRLDAKTEERYRTLCTKRAQHIPLQHITGRAYFMGYEFCVDERVLVPRQDTEVLVEEAISRMRNLEKPQILDMCTGSGCVLISILKNVHGTGGYGYDISKQAINVAKENAKLNDVPAIFERSNLFEDVADETFDVIVSNPPYIRSDEIPFLMPEVSEFEPHEALDGKEDGLFFYRKIIQESPDYLTDGGYLLFEIGYDQGWAVSSMMKEAGFEDVCVKKDLARNDRVVCGHKHLCEKRG